MDKNRSDISGINIEILSDIKENEHFHPEIEVIFVISGKVCVSTKCNYYELRKKDIILFNSNDMHQIETIDNSTVCRILISYKVLSGAIQNGNYIFYCNSVLDKMNSYTLL
ncbi:MAG TPA: hypothetical protein DG753_02990 [Clostridium sp.]|nr:hypothetical protein [Clostridium sp.]